MPVISVDEMPSSFVGSSLLACSTDSCRRVGKPTRNERFRSGDLNHRSLIFSISYKAFRNNRLHGLILTKSIEYTAKSCIFVQTHVMLDSCRKTRANSRQTVQSSPRFSRNESRVPREKCTATGQKRRFSIQKPRNVLFSLAKLVFANLREFLQLCTFENGRGSGGHLPVQRGGRFSRKARMPSLESSVCIKAINSFFST